MRVLDIAFGFPTVIFTTVLLVAGGNWILSMLLGFESGGGDIDFDFGGDGLDLSADGLDVGDGSGGADGAGSGPSVTLDRSKR